MEEAAASQAEEEATVSDLKQPLRYYIMPVRHDPAAFYRVPYTINKNPEVHT